MKRFILMLSVVTLSLSFAGCKPKENNTPVTPDSSITATEDETDKTPEDELHETHTDSTGSVVYDKEGIKIIAKQIEFTADHDPMFVFVIESDQKISPVIANVSINNKAIDEYSYSYHNNGEFYVGSILFETEHLNDKGITEISDFDFSFEISSPDTGKMILETGPLSLSLGAEGSLIQDKIK